MKRARLRCFLASQGKYRVKFLVDGEWRLAPEWQVWETVMGRPISLARVLRAHDALCVRPRRPMENDLQGETNNVLLVE